MKTRTTNSLKAETVKNRLFVRRSPERIRHAPAGSQTNIISNRLDGTVSKRYKERLKIQKHEPVTDARSDIKDKFL